MATMMAASVPKVLQSRRHPASLAAGTQAAQARCEPPHEAFVATSRRRQDHAGGPVTFHTQPKHITWRQGQFFAGQKPVVFSIVTTRNP
jgi:hypothetical protein